MKKFKFKLEAIITLREAAKEKALEAYANAIQKRQNQQAHYDSLSDKIKFTSQQINNSREKKFSADKQSGYLKNLQTLNLNLKNAFELLMKAHQEESHFLTQFLKAKSELEILLRLKEKQKNEHAAKELNAEEKMIEDLVNARAAQTI